MPAITVLGAKRNGKPLYGRRFVWESFVKNNGQVRHKLILCWESNVV